MLKAVVPSLDALSDSVKELYAPGEGDLQGMYVLQVEATEGLQLAPVTKLQNSLQAARAERDEAQKHLKAFKDEEGNLIDVETLKKAQGDLEAIKTNVPEDQKKQIEQLENNLKAQFAEREKKLAEKYQSDFDIATKRENSLKQQLHKAILISEATKAISAAGGEAEVLLPHIERHMKAEEISGQDGNVEIKYTVIDPATGQKRFSTKPGTTDDMTVDELVSELKSVKAFQGCFKPTNAANRLEANNNFNDNIDKVGEGAYNPIEALKMARANK